MTARTRLKNRLQGLLHTHQLLPPPEALFSRDQRAWWANLPLSEIDQLRCQQDLAALDLVEAHLKQLEQKLAAVSQQEPWRGDCLRLLQLPGVGLIVAMTLLAAIGDIGRPLGGFETPNHLVGYAGLGAAIDQSGDKHRHGGITKSGRKDLRHMMIEAARIAVRQPGHWQRLYQRRGALVSWSRQEAKPVGALETKNSALRLGSGLLPKKLHWIKVKGSKDSYLLIVGERRKIEALCPETIESEPRRIAAPERTQRMVSQELGYQVVRAAPASPPTASR